MQQYLLHFPRNVTRIITSLAKENSPFHSNRYNTRQNKFVAQDIGTLKIQCVFYFLI